jgi:hypothetical protein
MAGSLFKPDHLAISATARMTSMMCSILIHRVILITPPKYQAGSIRPASAESGRQKGRGKIPGLLI